MRSKDDELPEAEKIHVDLTGAPQTMLATLYAKALDAEAENPLLGDTWARDAVRRIDYDWRSTRITRRNQSGVTVRTVHFDNWAREFLALHDRAAVLHLGCGLDSRAFRLDPGPEVEWYDVDYPEVITLHEQLYPAREHHHRVAASVTDPAWLQAIPADRPVLMIAEGLTMYLTEDTGVALLRAVVEHFPPVNCNSTHSTPSGSGRRKSTRSFGAPVRRCTGRSMVPTTSSPLCPEFGSSPRYRYSTPSRSSGESPAAIG